jgi:hypothetical protein
MRITWLADVLREVGLGVAEHANWKTHERSGVWTPKFGVVHATAAPTWQADSVQIGIVRDGRSDLPGPIANACVGRSGIWHVLSAGRCNTTLQGTAGPFLGMGNSNALGVEACNNNINEPWSYRQYDSYVRGWAAICRRLGWTAENLVGHKEHTPGHKTDPTFDMNRFRNGVESYLAQWQTGDLLVDIEETLKLVLLYNKLLYENWAPTKDDWIAAGGTPEMYDRLAANGSARNGLALMLDTLNNKLDTLIELARRIADRPVSTGEYSREELVAIATEGSQIAERE